MNRLKALILSIAGVGIAALAGCASSAPAQAPVATTSTGVPVAAAEGSVPSVEEIYRLDSGDQVRITVFGEPDLSGEFELDGQGILSLPLIDDVEAKGKTVRDLMRNIEDKLRDGYLRNPQVSAEVITYRPYYILGEVNTPGEYPFTSGLTVMNAIASAGDFTYRADKRKVLIKSVGVAEEREIELTPSTVVRPGDTIRIRERFF